MDQRALRLLICTKLADGRLQRRAITHAWGGPANGETCTACDGSVLKGALVIEAVGQSALVRFHVRCFQLWYAEREARYTASDLDHPQARPTPLSESRRSC